MRRLTFLTLLVLGALETGALAQSISFGVRGGANYASASKGSDFTMSSKPSFVVGGLVEVELVRPLVFQAGIQYAEKHTSVSYTKPGMPKTDAKFNYFEIPITLKLAFGKPAFQVYGLAGVNLGTLLKAVSEFPAEGSGSVDIKANMSSTNMSLEFGGGVGIQVASHVSVVGDARYLMGLKDINSSGKDMLNTGAWKPRDLRITAGVCFKVGR